jgi:hypothetical protein
MEDTVIYKVYRLFGAGMSYYGSTHQPICERKANHKSHYKNKRVCCSSKIILDACEDWDLEIVEILPTGSTREDALLREKWWIDNNECVNRNSPITKTKEEMKEYKRVKAEEYRREKGVQPKKVGFDNKEYQREWTAKKRAERTPEQREEDNRKKREARANKLASMSEEELKSFREAEKARTNRSRV